MMAQVAGDFATLVSPPTLGAIAINMRFLTKAGLHPALAGASVGVSQVAAFVVHLLLLLGFGIAAGTQADFTFDPPAWAVIAVIGVAPKEFGGTTQNVDLWLPIVFTDLLAMDDPSGSSGPGGFSPAGPNGSNSGRKIRYVGRLRDGVGVARVETDLGVVAAGIVASSDAPDEPFMVEVLNDARVTVSPSGSVSLASSDAAVISTELPSSVVAAAGSSFATGATFAGSTATVTVAGALSKFPSLMV